MARLAWSLLLLAVACKASEVGRIVGGNPVAIEELPFMLQLQALPSLSVWTQICSAIVLTSSSVLTAAKCVSEPLAKAENRRILAGSTYRNTGGTTHNVALIINHPSYGQNRQDGDISVLRLAEALVYSDSVSQGSIIAQGTVIPDNLPVEHAGWGSSSFFGPRSEELTQVSVFTVNNALCAELYLNWPSQPVVTENMICAGLLDSAADGTCFGDAGSPLLYDNIVIGVASWGRTCGNGTYPDVSTAVSPYTDWIVANAS